LNEPDSLFPTGFDPSFQSSESRGLNPAFDLEASGATRGEDDDGKTVAHPACLDSGEIFLLRIGKNTKFEMAFGEFRSVSEDRGFQPFTGGRIIVLGEDANSSRATLDSRGKVCAEKEKIIFLHEAAYGSKEGQRIEVGQNTKESD